jgi:NADH:ubiquinone oxidoreductase subunit 6 (subunit J)
MFTSWVFPFEVISILLIVATTSALALAYEFKKSEPND